MILFIQHIGIEGPETLGEFFRHRKLPFKIIDLSQGNKLPKELFGIEAIISLGGPMNVYEEGKYSFLKEENEFLRRALENEIPVLGICLGSQLIAKASDAGVTKSPHKEIGFSTVQLTNEGKNDILFSGLNEGVEAFQWHEDTFDIPKGARLLATGQHCQNQAFRIGTCAYGLQFHIEITDKSIRDWAETYFDKENDHHQAKLAEMVSVYREKKGIFHKQANKIYENFLKVILQR